MAVAETWATVAETKVDVKGETGACNIQHIRHSLRMYIIHPRSWCSGDTSRGTAAEEMPEGREAEVVTKAVKVAVVELMVVARVEDRLVVRKVAAGWEMVVKLEVGWSAAAAMVAA
jgi:hypothetical protein